MTRFLSLEDAQKRVGRSARTIGRWIDAGLRVQAGMIREDELLETDLLMRERRGRPKTAVSAERLAADLLRACAASGVSVQDVTDALVRGSTPEGNKEKQLWETKPDGKIAPTAEGELVWNGRIGTVIDTRGMSYPMRCKWCGSVHDAMAVTPVQRYADCTVWKCPNCDVLGDDRPLAWGGSFERYSPSSSTGGEL